MIEVKNLYKSFGDKEVLRDINTKFEGGKINLIIGQSGAGKTVLLQCLVGLMAPTKGEVLYDDRDFVAMGKKEKIMMHREMGMIFQGSALFDSLSVFENVRFPLDMFSDMTPKERNAQAQKCIDRVNLTGAEGKFPGEISGGMQKRVAIARAIVMNPKYLFCDEPNSGLDPKTSLLIDELLADITKEFDITTIINTHDMNSVMGIGDNILFIADGRTEWKGNKETVMSSNNKKLNDLVFASELFKKVKKVENDMIK
jgi:ABC transporter, ATP-binding protein